MLEEREDRARVGFDERDEELPAGKRARVSGLPFRAGLLSLPTPHALGKISEKSLEEFRRPFPFRQGQQERRLGRTARALGGGIEFAERLDQVAEKFDTKRQVGLGWKNVNDASADRELPDIFHGLRRFVPDIGEVREKGLRLDFIAGFQLHGERRVKRSFAVAHERGEKWHKDDPAGSAREAPESRGAPSRNLGMRGATFVGRAVPGGKHAERRTSAWFEPLEDCRGRLREAVRSLVIGSQDNDGPAKSVGQARDRQRLGGERQAGERHWKVSGFDGLARGAETWVAKDRLEES